MAVGRINEVAALTGFSYEKMYGRFAGGKILAVITRWRYYRDGRQKGAVPLYDGGSCFLRGFDNAYIIPVFINIATCMNPSSHMSQILTVSGSIKYEVFSSQHRNKTLTKTLSTIKRNRRLASICCCMMCHHNDFCIQ